MNDYCAWDVDAGNLCQCSDHVFSEDSAGSGGGRSGEELGGCREPGMVFFRLSRVGQCYVLRRGCWEIGRRGNRD